MAMATAPFGASGLFSDGGIRPNDGTSAPTEFDHRGEIRQRSAAVTFAMELVANTEDEGRAFAFNLQRPKVIALEAMIRNPAR